MNETDGNLEQSIPPESAPSDAALGETAADGSLAAEPAAEAKSASRRANLAILFALAGWAVPGLGHALMKRWGRAVGFFLAVGGLAVTGALLRGLIFDAHGGDPFSRIGFYAQAMSGVFYMLARFIESAGPDLSRATGEFGTRFLAGAGIVNLLSVLDAFEIARGQRD